MILYSDNEKLEFEEYREFLTRTDLGSQYPKKNFEDRMHRLLKNIDICITARSEDRTLVGMCFGLTDFAYFLFLTDLGVDRSYSGQGIGRTLLEMAVDKAGGKEDITISTISNVKAVEFYAKCGVQNASNLVVRYCEDWEDFTVT